jgi:hypothetical protein
VFQHITGHGGGGLEQYKFKHFQDLPSFENPSNLEEILFLHEIIREK